MDEYYWTSVDFEKLGKANTMPELLAIAFSILERMPQPIFLVSGPISTGGHGSVAENLRVFADAIRMVRVSGKTVFNQLPFEDKFMELSERAKAVYVKEQSSSQPRSAGTWRDESGSNQKGTNAFYFTPILDEFFLPILKSGKIKQIIFLKDWQSSTGARWEYTVAGELGIDRIFM